MKHLTITYNGTTLFDGDVSQMSWSESDDSISVKAGTKPSSPKASLAGLGEVISQFASRKPAEEQNGVESPVQ